MIRNLLNKIRRKREPHPQPPQINYSTFVFMRQAGERLCRLEEQLRAIEQKVADINAGQGEAVTTARMEFEMLIEANKTALQTQIDRHDEMIGEVVGVINQMNEKTEE
jgi:hypothetical protein